MKIQLEQIGQVHLSGQNFIAYKNAPLIKVLTVGQVITDVTV